MFRFYFLLWVRWAFRVTLSTLLFGTVFSLLVTGLIYLNQGLVPLNEEVISALTEIFIFWFFILGNIALLLSLFREMKGIFNKCHSGFNLELLSCEKESEAELITSVGYGDLVKIWRKWFMLIIWFTGAQMIMAVVFSALLSSSESIFSWFNIYVLYGFILIAGYFSFIVLSARCKRVRIKKC